MSDSPTAAARSDSSRIGRADIRSCDRNRPSEAALTRASERLRAHTHVELVSAAVPDGLPDGPFDLVVCSEVLYYLSADALLETLRGIEQRLAVAGALVAVHFREGVGGRMSISCRRRSGARPVIRRRSASSWSTTRAIRR